MTGAVYDKGFSYNGDGISITHHFSRLRDPMGNPVEVGFFGFNATDGKQKLPFGEYAAFLMDEAFKEYFKSHSTHGVMIHGIDVGGEVEGDRYCDIDVYGLKSMGKLCEIQLSESHGKGINGMIPVKNVPEWLLTSFLKNTVFYSKPCTFASFYTSERDFMENFLMDAVKPIRPAGMTDINMD